MFDGVLLYSIIPPIQSIFNLNIMAIYRRICIKIHFPFFFGRHETSPFSLLLNSILSNIQFLISC